MMDHRKLDFDHDYREFKRQISDLDVRQFISLLFLVKQLKCSACAVGF